MDQIIVFKNDDGTCGIVHPTPEGIALLGIEGVARKDVPEGKPYRITTRESIPADRYFRNAWTDDNETETVDVDIEKARLVHMDNLRLIRNEKLEVLDQEYMRADEQGDAVKKAEVAQLKQQLRDMPVTFDLAQFDNEAELKSAIPEYL